MKRKAIFFVVYFGRLPDWVPLFISTANSNPDYDWLIFTDDMRYNKDTNTNVQFRKLTLDKFNDIIYSMFGTRIRSDNLYKVCDFKPIFGSMFREYINHDYFGHTDLDVIWGRLNTFLGDIYNYDIITPRSDNLTGHFTLYKTDLIDDYNQVPNLQKILSSGKYESFDETIYYDIIQTTTNRILTDIPIIDWKMAPHGRWHTRNGLFDYSGNEYMYFHFKNDIKLLSSLTGDSTEYSKPRNSISREGNKIVKTFGASSGYTTELKTLTDLQDYKFIPRIFSQDPIRKEISMEYVGRELRGDEINKWRRTIRRYLREVFQDRRIYHNDLSEWNICLREDQLFIIDWEQASKNDDQQFGNLDLYRYCYKSYGEYIKRRISLM